MKEVLIESNNMAKFRMIKDNIWHDDYFFELKSEEKFLFLFLLTNQETNIAGIYQLGMSGMSISTAIPVERVKEIFKKFELGKKIYYINGWVFITKFIIHQSVENLNVRKGIIRAIKEVPDELLEKIMPLGLAKSLNYLLKFAEEDERSILELLKLVSKDLKGLEGTQTESDNLTKLNLTKLNLTKEYVQLMEAYKSINAGSILTDKAKKKIKDRLKIFSVDKLLLAIQKFSKDKWWMEHNADRGIAWFFHTDDRIDQFLNLKPDKKEDDEKWL